MGERLRGWRTRWIALAIAIGGGGVLIYSLIVARPLWVDEEMLALNVRDRTFGQLAGPLWLDQSAPFGWLVLERLLILGLGTSERSVRLLNVVFGVGTLATALWIGTRWMTGFGAAVLVSLCAFGEWLVFFSLELKQYSSDAFWALLLPALAASSLERLDAPERSTRTTAAWWLVASIGVWFSNGAVFVAPACAVAILIVTWRRAGWRRALRTAAPGALWVASFAAEYVLVLRHALANPFLNEYWAFAFPPVGDGLLPTFRWLARTVEAFPIKPAGSGFPALFWIATAVGIGVGLAHRRLLALTFVTVPISALLLALFHVVPIFERLALWIVPSFYVAGGLCADSAVELAGVRHPRRLIASFAGAFAGIVVLIVVGDIIWRGVDAIAGRPRSNYGLDDRSSIRRVLNTHRAGDAIVTTHFGLAALWWYGGFNVADSERAAHLPDDGPVFELRHVPDERDCSRANADLSAALKGRDRVAVYLGFRLNVLPEGFDDLVMRDLGRLGGLVSYKEYAEKSQVAIFDFGTRAADDASSDRTMEPIRRFGLTGGCVTAVPARRW